MSGANIRTKICGLKNQSEIDAAFNAGAGYVGFVFFEKSPRNIGIEQAATLCANAPVGLCKVGLVVNPTDADLDQILGAVPLDMLQLHGSETPERVSEVKAKTGLPVMKAVGIADQDDLPKIDAYARVADQILVDAKPPKNAELPGGNGLSFDWKLIAGRRWAVPWMLAGGLNPENVAQAIKLTGTTQVDVSSGVEDAPGVKSLDLIKAFCRGANTQD